MKEFILKENELDKLFTELPNKGIILLQGELGSGKTTLVKKWMHFLNLEEDVSSPTFSIMQKYEKENQLVYHYDIYQQGLEGILKNGLFENFFEEALHLVEWGDESLKNALTRFHLQCLSIKISFLENERKYEIYE